MGSFSLWHWLILLLVVALVFGTGKLRNLGKDVGSAIRGFKEGIGEESDLSASIAHPAQSTTLKSDLKPQSAEDKR